MSEQNLRFWTRKVPLFCLCGLFSQTWHKSHESQCVGVTCTTQAQQQGRGTYYIHRKNKETIHEVTEGWHRQKFTSFGPRQMKFSAVFCKKYRWAKNVPPPTGRWQDRDKFGDVTVFFDLRCCWCMRRENFKTTCWSSSVRVSCNWWQKKLYRLCRDLQVPRSTTVWKSPDERSKLLVLYLPRLPGLAWIEHIFYFSFVQKTVTPEFVSMAGRVREATTRCALVQTAFKAPGVSMVSTGSTDRKYWVLVLCSVVFCGTSDQGEFSAFSRLYFCGDRGCACMFLLFVWLTFWILLSVLLARGIRFSR